MRKSEKQTITEIGQAGLGGDIRAPFAKAESLDAEWREGFGFSQMAVKHAKQKTRRF
ncbi:MAG TPA: hypothetical protein VFJ73_03780 [Bacillales bacterium]|nr:hypothetical protein [Bacillales bacterium]